MAKSQKKKSVQKVLTRQRVQVGLMLVLGLVLLYQTIQFYRLKDSLAFIDSLEERNSEVIREVSESEGYLSNFAQDLNDIRQFLLLPTKDYNFGDPGEEVELSEENEEDLTTMLFTYVEKLGTYEQNQERYEANLGAFQTALTDAYWSEKGLSVNSAGEAGTDGMIFSFKDPALNGTELFSVELGYDGLFSVDSLDASWSFDDREVAENTLKELKALVDSDLEEIREQVKLLEAGRSAATTLISTQAAKDALAQKGITVSTELNSPKEYYYEFKNVDAEALAKLAVSKEDGAITLTLVEPMEGYDSEFSLGADGVETLIEALVNGVDSRSASEKLVEEREKEMESVFADRAFKAVLQELELQMGVKNETDARISYPILRVDGQTLRIIYIDKTTGEVNVETPDGTEAHTLSMAIELIDLTGKKKLSTRLLS